MSPPASLARQRKLMLDYACQHGMTRAARLFEHYRVAFRLRYYCSAEEVDADLQGYLRHYNFERPHRGRRLQGATPASRFYAHDPELLTVKGW